MASITHCSNFICKPSIPPSITTLPKFLSLHSLRSSLPIFHPPSLLSPIKSRVVITKATAAPGAKKKDERVQKVHSIEEFDQALVSAKDKLVVVEYATKENPESTEIYPFLVDLSRTCNDVEFIFVMGDESEKTKELCKREKLYAVFGRHESDSSSYVFVHKRWEDLWKVCWFRERRAYW
ncbi:Thioredoxin-like protein cdsp32 [Lathyrus oleraceus]|uniref:Thioredoxin-like protein cdsp32 n=1 Tax=Pisum sativum TaxID=3888 RepID=A0A9D5A4L7_PEA|nr:Thioredoxin-like protein cdsp32 [Pisum sativum]